MRKHQKDQKDQTIASMFTTAKKLARRYGQIGIQDQDDIVQNTMLRVLRQGQHMPNLSWLGFAVRSSAMDAVRHKTRDAKLICYGLNSDFGSLCELADERGMVHINGALRVRENSVEPDVDEMIDRFFDQLSAPALQVVVLYAHGFTYEEIAELTDTSLGTVRSRLFYARKKARKFFENLN